MTPLSDRLNNAQNTINILFIKIDGADEMRPKILRFVILGPRLVPIHRQRENSTLDSVPKLPSGMTN